jgi:hypothetical protein
MHSQFAEVLKYPGVTKAYWKDLRRTCSRGLLQDHGLGIERVSKWRGRSSTDANQKSHGSFWRASIITML